jgi:hypothetical protein
MKSWKKIVLGLSAVLLICSIYGATQFKKYKWKARRAEGKLLAGAIKMYLRQEYNLHHQYPAFEKLENEMSSAVKTERYRFGISVSPVVSSFCEDCEIRKDKYKIAVFGNIDDDEELDIFYVKDDVPKFVDAQQDL